MGIKLALIAANDTYHTVLTNEILDLEIFERILLEKPGSLNSWDLEQLCDKADEKGVTMFIDYQRSLDDRVLEVQRNVAEDYKNGFALDYISVTSMDHLTPPQDAPQIKNQGVHDYAVILSVLEAAGMDLLEV